MLALYLTFTAVLTHHHDRVKTRLAQAPRDDKGLATLEIVVIGLGLFLLATAVVVAVRAAVMNRVGQIQ